MLLQLEHFLEHSANLLNESIKVGHIYGKLKSTKENHNMNRMYLFLVGVREIRKQIMGRNLRNLIYMPELKSEYMNFNVIYLYCM